MDNTPIVMERIYNAPADKVWKAITDAEQMKQWYFDIPGFKAEVGYKFQFIGCKEEEEFLHLCEVKEVVAGKKLSHSWRYDGFPGDSLVTWELFSEGDKTRVVLTHEGIESFEGDKYPDLAKECFMEGWTSILGTSLTEFVETGTIKRTAEINAGKENVWDILTNSELTSKWAGAFGEGVYVETDWKQGSQVLWKDKTGDTGARGIVTTHQPQSKLVVSFFDEIESMDGEVPGEYSENYSLSEKDGKTILHFEAGPLSLMHVKSHSELWDKAVVLIKEMAE